MKKKRKPKLMTPTQQREHLDHRFGTEGNWISTIVPLTHDEMTKHFGGPCKEDERGCACCDAWHEWNTTGKATVLMDRDTLVDHLLNSEL